MRNYVIQRIIYFHIITIIFLIIFGTTMTISYNLSEVKPNASIILVISLFLNIILVCLYIYALYVMMKLTRNELIYKENRYDNDRYDKKWEFLNRHSNHKFDTYQVYNEGDNECLDEKDDNK